MGSQFKQWIGRTYAVFENKSAIPFLNYKPTEEIFERVVNIFMRQNRRAINRANAKQEPWFLTQSVMNKHQRW